MIVRSRANGTAKAADEAEGATSLQESRTQIQVNEGTLGNWVHKYRVDHVGEEPPLSISERARLRELEREARELR